MLRLRGHTGLVLGLMASVLGLVASNVYSVVLHEIMNIHNLGIDARCCCIFLLSLLKTMTYES